MHQKNLKLITALFVIAALLLQPALAAGTDSAFPKHLRFVNSLDTAVYSERLVFEVFKRLGIEVSVTLTDTSSALESVNVNIFDGICNQEEGIEDIFANMVVVPVETSHSHTYVISPSNNPIHVTSPDDLKGKRIGTLIGKVRLEMLLSGTDIIHIEKSGMSDLYNSLREGECDLIIMEDTSGRAPNELVLQGDLRVAGLLESAPCHIYLNKQHAGLIEPITAVLREMEADGSLAKIKAMKPLQTRTTKSVLHLSSYSAEMMWEEQLARGINNVLNKRNDIVFHNISLNAYRNTDVTLRENAALSAITADFITSPPDAVIVSDNEALRFVMNNYNTILPNSIPVVFCGLNNRSVEVQWKDNGNVFGLREHISAAETADEMLELFPDTKSIFIVNDYSLTGQRWRDEIADQLSPLADKVNLQYNENTSCDALMERVKSLDEETLILCGSYFLDAENRYYTQPEFQMRLSDSANVAVFGLLDTSQGYGQLGGKYINAVRHGEAVANLLAEALDSESFYPAGIAEREDDCVWVFDQKIMDQHGIKKGELPSGTVILNAKLSLRETNPTLFYLIVAGMSSGIVIIILLVIFTIILRKRNRLLVLAGEDLRHSREEILAVKNRLQTTLETAPIAYSLMVDDVVVECNRYYKENMGYREGHKTAEKYSPESGYSEYIRECKEKGFVNNINWPVVKSNNEVSRYLYYIAKTEYEGQDAIVLWGVEVEVLERQKDMLSQAYNDLNQVIASTPLPIALICPEEKRFLSANSSWKELFKIPDEVAAADMSWEKGWLLTDNPMDKLLENALEADGVFSCEWGFKTFDGEPLDIEVYFRKIIYNGKACLVVAHKDLREEKAREQMLARAAQKEHDANRLKSHFLMNMSHEIRTPLNAIIGISQLAKASDGIESLLEDIAQISKSASVLLNIVNQVLDLSLIEDGKMALTPERARLSDLICSIEAVMNVECVKKNINCSVHFEDLVHDYVLIDSSRLQQVLIALGSNAVKFTPPGGDVELTVKEISASADSATFGFYLKDTGIGIEQDKMDRLFKPFEQADDSITRQHGGAGLGLSIVKRIVEMMGSQVSVESEFGKGSTFSFAITVPFVSDNEVPEETTAAIDAGKESPDFNALRVLIVDDVDINRLITSELLEELGIKTEQAENGRQAVEMVTASPPGYYDLVFMDVQMPVLDGCSAVREIRALDRPDAAMLPISAMTANTMPDDIKMVMESGMNGYVGKPVLLENLIEMINRLL